METEDRMLLRQIRANPEEDTVRLAFADWLEENGTEADRNRSHFIRKSIKYADRDFEWMRKPDYYAVGFDKQRGDYSRGFCTRLLMPSIEEFLSRCGTVFATEPVINRVEIDGMWPSRRDYTFRWFRLRPGQTLDGDEIPGEVFDQLEPMRRVVHTAHYLKETDALDDLSHTLVRIGLRRAGWEGVSGAV